MSQEDLSSKARIAVRTIRDIETGRSGTPRPATLRLLADAFGLNEADRDRFHEAAHNSTTAEAVEGPNGIDTVGDDDDAGGAAEDVPCQVEQDVPSAAIVSPPRPAATGQDTVTGKDTCVGIVSDDGIRAKQWMITLPARPPKWLTAALVVVVAATGLWSLTAVGPRVVNLFSSDREPIHIWVQPMPRSEIPSPSPASSQPPAAQRHADLWPLPSVSARRKAPISWVFESILPTSPTLAKLNASGSNFGEWSMNNSGFELGYTHVRMMGQGGDRPVSIVNIRAVIVERHPIPTGSIIIYQDDIGGGNGTMFTELDLDRPESPASYFADHTVTVGRDEFFAIDIKAHTLNSALVWDLAVDMIVAGTRQTMIVTRADGQQHFRTAASPAGGSTSQYSRGFVYDFRLKWWKACPPQGCSTTG